LDLRLRRGLREKGIRSSGSLAIPIGNRNSPAGVALDIASAREPEKWLPVLNGVDAVVNCAGVVQDGGRENTVGVHAAGVGALFDACEQRGVHRVIHLSAIGVDRAQPSSFSATKYAGDRHLMARDLDWVILRPSVVLGRPVCVPKN
jgi:uncharacterized protein YbjT (DUF2867 family)